MTCKNNLTIYCAIQGYLLGNPTAFPSEINFRYTFAHGMGIISDELYEVCLFLEVFIF